MSEALVERLRHWLFCNEFTHQHKEDLREAADRLEAAERKVAELEAERDDLAQRAAVIDEALTNAVQLRTAAEADKAQLSEALWEIKQSANQRALDIGTAGALLVDIDRAARAALGSGWRAIETDTPPHDVPVLLWQPPSMSHPNGLIEARPFSTGRSGKGWSEYSQHSWATHWMPLPASPSTAGER